MPIPLSEYLGKFGQLDLLDGYPEAEMRFGEIGSIRRTAAINMLWLLLAEGRNTQQIEEWFRALEHVHGGYVSTSDDAYEVRDDEGTWVIRPSSPKCPCPRYLGGVSGSANQGTACSHIMAVIIERTGHRP